jgi:hypothetical protein
LEKGWCITYIGQHPDPGPDDLKVGSRSEQKIVLIRNNAGMYFRGKKGLGG